MYKGERINSISHLVGAVTRAGRTRGARGRRQACQADAWKIVSFSIYGTTLVTLYSFSTFYHSLRGKAKHFFQKLDHAAIYLLIAGTYTPFMLVMLRDARGWTMFGVIWGLALIGLTQDVLLKKRNQVLSVSLYLIMGWLALAVFRPLAQVLPRPGVVLAGCGRPAVYGRCHLLRSRQKDGLCSRNLSFLRPGREHLPLSRHPLYVS